MYVDLLYPPLIQSGRPCKILIILNISTNTGIVGLEFSLDLLYYMSTIPTWPPILQYFPIFVRFPAIPVGRQSRYVPQFPICAHLIWLSTLRLFFRMENQGGSVKL